MSISERAPTVARPAAGAYIAFLWDAVEPWRAALLILFGALIALTEGMGLFLLVPLLQLIGVDVGAGPTARVAAIAGNVLEAVGLPLTLGPVLAIYVAVVAVQAGLVYAEAVYAVRTRESMFLRLRTLVYSSIARASWPAFLRRHSSFYVHLLTTQLDRVYMAIVQLMGLVTQLLVALVYVAFALRLSAALSGMAIAAGAALVWATKRHTRELRSAGEAVREASERFHTTVVEHLSNMKVVKSFGVEERHISHFADVSRSLAVHWGRSGSLLAQSRAMFSLGAVAILAVIVYGGISVYNLAPAGVLLLLYLFARLVPRLGAMQYSFQQIGHAFPAVRATVSELQRCRASRHEPAEANGAIGLDREIVLDTVSFRYEPDRTALQKVSLEIPARQITVLAGRSGAGKTTLADLLLGLLRPDGGTLSIDGRVLSDEVVPSWRSAVGYVPQETVLFDDTVRNNLLWAAPHASDAELSVALAAAGADFILSDKGGLDRRVGERGTALSGGERQRVALARALLRHPQLLVLDEPTSGLDADTERTLLSTLDRLRGEVTIVLISHRPAAVGIADVVYEIEGGLARRAPSPRAG